MIIQECPLTFLPTLLKLLTQFHPTLTIIIILCRKTAYHIRYLWRLVTAKEDLAIFIIDEEYLVVRTVTTSHFITDVVIDGTITFRKDHVIVVSQQGYILRMVGFTIIGEGVFILLAVYVISSVWEGELALTGDRVCSRHPTGVVLMQVAHEHFGDLHGIYTIINQVLVYLEYAIRVTVTKPCVKKDVILFGNHQERLDLYKEGTARSFLHVVYRPVVRNEFLGSVYCE